MAGKGARHRQTVSADVTFLPPPVPVHALDGRDNALLCPLVVFPLASYNILAALDWQTHTGGYQFPSTGFDEVSPAAFQAPLPISRRCPSHQTNFAQVRVHTPVQLRTLQKGHALQVSHKVCHISRHCVRQHCTGPHFTKRTQHLCGMVSHG